MNDRPALPPSTLPFTVKPSPLLPGGVTHEIVAGRSIIGILTLHNIAARPGHRLVVEVDGEIRPPEVWEEFEPEAGSIMIAIQLPLDGGDSGGGGGGGKSPLRTVATIAIIAGAVATGGAAVGALGLTGTAFGGFLGAVTTAAVASAGNYALNQIYPQAGIAAGQANDRPNSVTGQRNQVRPFLPIPVVLGQVRMSPPLLALPYTSQRGDDLELNLLMTCGIGPIEITDIRAGDTPVGQVDGLTVETREGRPADIFPTLFNRSIVEQNPNIDLILNDPITLVTEPDTVEIQVDVFFPEGVSDRRGGSRGNVQYVIGFRINGTGDPFTVPALDTQINNEYNYPKRISYRIPNLSAQLYDVRITRTTRGGSRRDGTNRMVWAALRSKVASVETSIPNLSLIAIRANVDGTLNNINCLAQKLLPAFTGTPTVWTTESPSSNPAAHYRYLLQGPATARTLPDSKLDLPAIEAFYDRNVTESFTYDGVFEDFASARQRVLTVLAAGRATISRPNGNYGVVVDAPNATPIAMLSPRNSRGFSVTRIFDAPPNALRVRFLDIADDFKAAERLVFDDGFNEGNITAAGIEVLDLTSAGAKTSDIAYREGRFEIAKRRLRVETYTVIQGLDQLVLAQGDLCKLQHDVLVVGLGSFRITSVSGSGGDVDEVTIDGDVTMEIAKTYAARIRFVDASGADQFSVATVTTAVGTTQTLSFPTGFSAPNVPAVGDLLFFGESGLVTIDAIVREIRRVGQLDAELTLFEAAPDIHTADTGAIPTYNPGTTVPGRYYGKPPNIPIIESVFTRVLSSDSAPTVARVVNLYISLRNPAASAQPPSGYAARLRIKTDETFTIRQSFPGTAGVLEITNLVPGTTYEFQVQALGTSGQLTGANSNFTAIQEILIPIPSTSKNAPQRVTGLELEGQGDDTSFLGQDATFIWRYTGGKGAFSLPRSTLIGTTEIPSSVGFIDSSFSHFEVTIRDTVVNEVRRVEQITTPRYTYLFTSNVEDGQKFRRKQLTSGPARALSIEVVTVDSFGNRSPVARLPVINPAPAEPLGVRIEDGSDHYSVKATFPSDPDATKLLIWASQSSGFTPANENLVAAVASNRATVTTGSGITTFIRAAFADAFSEDPNGLNLSSELVSQTLAVVASPPLFSFEGLQFDTDGVGQITWGAHTAKISDAGVISTVSVSAGSANFSSSPVYIYYEQGETQLDNTTVADVALAVDRVIVAIYSGGSSISTANGDAFIDGGRVVANSILTSSIGVGQITADLLGVDSVIAGKVDADAIGARELKTELLIADEAQLGDLTVAGRTIQELAAARITTAITGAQTANQKTSGQWTGVQAVNVVCDERKPTLILHNFILRFQDTTDRTGLASHYEFFVRVLRQGAIIKEEFVAHREPADTNTQFLVYLHFMDIDPSPPLGTNNYDVQIKFEIGTGINTPDNGMATRNREIWIQEVKK